jgi:hypothetical protein
VADGEVELDFDLAPLVLELLGILDEVLLHFARLFGVEEFEGALELADGLLVFAEEEVDAGLDLVHVPHLEYLAVVLVLAADEFVELLDLREVGLPGGVLLDPPADFDDFHVAVVLVVEGQLPVLAEEGHGGFVLAQQEVALGLGEDQVVVVVEVCAVAEGGEAVLVGAVLEEEVAGPRGRG